jgi:hypothetical protein
MLDRMSPFSGAGLCAYLDQAFFFCARIRSSALPNRETDTACSKRHAAKSASIDVFRSVNGYSAADVSWVVRRGEKQWGRRYDHIAEWSDSRRSLQSCR